MGVPCWQTVSALLATLVWESMKAKRAQLEKAMVGTIKPHPRFLLREQFVLLDILSEAIDRMNWEIEPRMISKPR
jgi:transposase